MATPRPKKPPKGIEPMPEDLTDERPAGRKIRLTPPPRVDANPRRTPQNVIRPGVSGATANRKGRVLKWLTVVAFAVLLAAAAAVFLVLPNWVQENPPAPEPPAGAPEPARVPGQTPVAPSQEPVVAAKAPRQSPVPQASRARPETTPSPAKPPADEPVDGAFVEAMSEGLTALDREDYPAAREAFERARSLDPESPETADGLARAEAGLRRGAIAAHHENALGLETQENWRAAAEHYAAVLEIDPTVKFAQDGQARAGERAELSERIDRHIANPGRLSSETVLGEASALLSRASAIEEAGPRLRRQVEELGRWVEAFSTPVRAQLRSDNLTEVVVYKVGRLGTFSERALDLRPGTYTVVGSRQGYRDVRRQLIIEPGEAPEPLRVRCEEKI